MSPAADRVPQDSSGYVITPDDLRFLKISASAFDKWKNNLAPLGVTQGDYAEACRLLIEALERDKIRDADIRIQGSSARFFSSPIKPMPYPQADLINQFLESYTRMPSRYESDGMRSRLDAQWPAPGPAERPFDALFVIGAHQESSDIDYQISSNDAKVVLEERANELGVELGDLRAAHPTYNFFVKEMTESAFVNVSIWRTQATQMIRRPVSIAFFDAGGPPVSNEPISSHFRDSDWIVR